MDFVTEKLQQTLQQLIATGYELPIRFALISTNGVILAGQFQLSATRDAVETNFITEHDPRREGMLLPINIMFADSRGSATRVCIESQASEATSIQ